MPVAQLTQLSSELARDVKSYCQPPHVIRKFVNAGVPESLYVKDPDVGARPAVGVKIME
jgi:methylaspartate ammonia-lyase